ncbi:GNAT family N-acetyltransferase [Garciella nitratireducens]|uniref:Phosphinothricin acetyltransferase n=1 Tax=Garciella nitratireducens DSM 15102 TaxID=1121911 RepID=A0A1T4KYY9_9FIRM|nr:GNAT family N-acetyltransferase [Garciella nitratireducens]RBP38963.1 phosphinothricin acetyltransferase [Garciella nitratireducens]SJZ47540.1 phosphinothricin acetyltransferase [Garciella nitratireducens DSM 15102]
MKKNIRIATKNDSVQILEIYTPFITDTTITFDCKVPTIDAIENKIINVGEKYPWLVCELEEKVIGYAYAYEFADREAYNWSVTTSIYVKPEFHRNKIGKALYFSLLEILKLQGYCNVYARITDSNVKSEKFHERFGFTQIGIHEKAGYKFGKWLDVKWYGLNIIEHPQFPKKPKKIQEIHNTLEFHRILQEGEKMIYQKEKDS